MSDWLVLAIAAFAMVLWPALLAYRLSEENFIPRVGLRPWVKRVWRSGRP